MCGIVAVWSGLGGLGVEDAAGPARALGHRGPDGHGAWASPSGRAALAHTRLAIIDPEGGRQPIGNRDGSLQIVVNGEFYGYEAIRQELLGRGRRLRTHSDSEIALHLYEEAGCRALHRLRGEFALAIWDERRGELLAARDRFGIKPLFYAERDGRLLLASEVKALLAAGVPARWDVDAFLDHLHLCHPADRTLFAGVRQVPPGCYLLAGPAGVVVRRWWDLDYPPAGELAGDGGDLAGHVAAVRAAARDAVRVRLRADVPVGFHLSGGLDSSSVVALASRERRATTFTVRFDDPAVDESAVARRTAAHLGTWHHEIPVGRADFADRLVETIRCGEMLQENAHGIARFLQSGAIRARGYKVVVAGEGGDELFAGYPQLQKDLAISLSPELRASTVASYARLAAHGTPPHLGSLLRRLGFVPTWVVDRYLKVTLPVLPLLRDEVARRLTGRDCGEELLGRDGVADQLAGRTPFHQSLYLFCKTWLCNYILAAERLDMAHGLEVRLPLLDHHLLDLVKRTPLRWYTHQGRTKYPLREAMRPELPEEVYAGAKRGFFAPPVAAHDGMLALLRELAHSRAMRDNPLFDQGRALELLRRVSQQPSARRGHNEPVLQLLAGTCVLSDVFKLGVAA